MKLWVSILLLCSPVAAHPMDSLRMLPLTFEANLGQAGRQFKFVASRPDYALLLQPSGALVRHARGSIHIAFQGSSRAVAMEGVEALPGRANYITGNRPERWLTSIPVFSKVLYRGIYPGVNLLFHSSRGALEFDFVVAPGARPDAIALRIEGAGRLRIDQAGTLVVGESGLRLSRPLIYQGPPGARRPVAGAYSLEKGGEIRVRLSGYDTAQPLVIDPVLSFSTYLGGSGPENAIAGSDMKGGAIATDTSGNVYVTGSTGSTDFPGAKVGASETASADLFVAKFSPAGELIYSTRIGGSQLERGFGIAVDAAGNAYVAGRTQSLDFPTVNAAQPAFGGKEDAYALKLNPAGTQLVYSTFLGGNDTDFACGITIDGAGNAYITGDADSPNFPVTAGALGRQYSGGTDVFVAKLSAAGALAYATYLGGRGFDHGESIAVDAGGAAYVTGYTNSTDFPLAGALQTTQKGVVDAFVAKLNAAGSQLLYSTYLGGANVDGGVFVAVDEAGSAHIAGVTLSTDFPVTAGVVQPAAKGESDAFVTKLSPEGSVMAFSTLLGGAKSDGANGVAIDAAGNVYVVGSTRSPEFPVVDAVQATHGGNDDVFVSKLNPAGSQLLLSTFLGGSGWELGWGIALHSGSISVTGRAVSADFPLVKPYQSVLKGDRDAFVARITEVESAPRTFVSVSAASFRIGSALAPNSLASGFGENLATATAAASGLPLPDSLAGVTVKVKDAAGVERVAPLLFVSPKQINYLVPDGVRSGSAQVTVYNDGTVVAAGLGGIDRVAPALFSMNGDGQGVAAAMAVRVAADGRQTIVPAFTCGTQPLSCVPLPIRGPAVGEQVILVLFGTGIRGRTSLDQVQVQIGGFMGEVLYAGDQIEFAGLDQVNVKLPPMPNVRGRQALWLTVEGRTANMVEISVE